MSNDLGNKQYAPLTRGIPYVSKKTVISSLAIVCSTLLFANPLLHAADDDQLLTSEERAEEHRKLKPKIAEREGIRAALAALQSNGALQRANASQSNNLAQRSASRNSTRVSAQADQTITPELVAIKHVLTCDTEADCQAAVEWSTDNSFSTTGVLTSEGHGGEVMYHLFLRQTVAPDENAITSESTRVHEGVKTLGGIRYATWMVDFDPEGAQDREGNE